MKLLRRALEDNESSGQDGAEQTIVMKGPLAEVYTNALNVAYAKDNPNAETQPTEEQVAAMESQQMDVEVMQKLYAAVADNNAPPTNNFQTVYGVSRDEVSEDVVVDVTKELAQLSAQQDEAEFILIVDATQPSTNGEQHSNPVERVEQLGAALETIVEAHGGRVFHSLKDYAASRKQ
jgi:hypothetical protein